jgi:hypothetical protein
VWNVCGVCVSVCECMCVVFVWCGWPCECFYVSLNVCEGCVCVCVCVFM